MISSSFVSSISRAPATPRVLLAVSLLIASVHPARAGPPQRVVSVNVASDEILLALVPERLVAVSVLADNPDVSSAAREATRVPVKVKAEVERILALRPDVVAIGGEKAAVATQLEELGVRVVRIQGFESIAWIEDLIRTLGDAVGARPGADGMVASMHARLDAIRRRVAGTARPRVLTYSPWGGTAGRETLFDDVIHAAGGENLAAALGLRGFRRLSLESVVAADPDAIVFTAWRRWAPGFRDEFLSHPALQGLRAFRGGRVYELPGRLMVAASQHVADTVEALAALLHPDAFAGASR